MRFPTNSVLVSTVVLAALGAGCTQSPGAGEAEARVSGTTVPLRAIQNESNGSIAIYREGEDEPIVTQNAAPGTGRSFIRSSLRTAGGWRRSQAPTITLTRPVSTGASPA